MKILATKNAASDLFDNYNHLQRVFLVGWCPYN